MLKAASYYEWKEIDEDDDDDGFESKHPIYS